MKLSFYLKTKSKKKKNINFMMATKRNIYKYCFKVCFVCFSFCLLSLNIISKRFSRKGRFACLYALLFQLSFVGKTWSKFPRFVNNAISRLFTDLLIDVQVQIAFRIYWVKKQKQKKKNLNWRWVTWKKGKWLADKSLLYPTLISSCRVYYLIFIQLCSKNLIAILSCPVKISSKSGEESSIWIARVGQSKMSN